jgi:hypothetical protein
MMAGSATAKWFEMMRQAQFAGIAATLGVAFLTGLTASADARGVHGFGGELGRHSLYGRGMHGAQFAGDRRHGNDTYTKAASDEEDKLLNTKIKSICRGC